jgi:hypothetical protein
MKPVLEIEFRYNHYECPDVGSRYRNRAKGGRTDKAKSGAQQLDTEQTTRV